MITTHSLKLNRDDFNYISGQLRQTEEIARSKGYAVAIGHPKAQTYLALKAWLPTVKGKATTMRWCSNWLKPFAKKTAV